MLSKVIGRSAAGGAEAAVFPTLSGYELGAARRVSSEESQGLVREGDNDGVDSVGLREKLHQLESQTAAERREAFEAGRHQGEQQARLELQPVLERLNDSITQVLGMRADLRRRAEGDVVKLALLIAKRVLHRQLNVDEGALTAIARVAFERLMRSESYSVTVHPQFAAAVASAVPGSHASRVHIESDPDCAPGTLIIRSVEGTIDASVDAQLEEINRGLTDRLGAA